ncbi:MAG: response regulator [Bacteroidota bacterium]
MERQGPRNILIVDDEPHIIVAIEFLMKEQGYHVLTAGDGKEALEVMNTFSPDLIILDVMMPNMNGLEAAKEIRKNPKWSESQIVFLTAKGTDTDKLNGYGSGGDTYLTKPFDNDELVRRVNEMLTYG